MNTKSTSKRKSADYRKGKLKNEQAEVFVLPPNLLEKLGIKLDNIRSTENSTTDPKNPIDLAVNNTEDYHETTTDTYANTDKLDNNESESSILETASLMKESVFLSPTFVSTVANMIPGEVEIASVHRECQNNNDNPIQGAVNNKGFELPLRSEQQLLNELESVNTTQIDPIISIKVHENDLSDIKDNCEYSKTPTISDSIATDNMELQNISLKPNENQEKKKNQIKIINDEIIDFAKINKLINLDNNNVFTPVTVGMLLPPTKAFSNSKLNLIESSSNQSYRNDANCLDTKKCESNCENVEFKFGCRDAHNGNGDVTQVSTSLQSDDVKKLIKVSELKNDQLKCLNTPNLLDAAAENKDSGSNTLSNVNCVDIIQDHDSQDFPVFTESIVVHDLNTDIATDLLKRVFRDITEGHNSQDFPILSESVVSSEVSSDVATELKKYSESNINSIVNCVDNIEGYSSHDFSVLSTLVVSSEFSTNLPQNVSTDFEAKSQINSAEIEEINTVRNEKHNLLPEKKYVNESCNNVTEDNICSGEQNKYERHVESNCTSVANDVKKDSENGLRISKLCKQGVEKPGGQSKAKSSIIKVYCNKQIVNKPKPDTKNNKQTQDKIPKLSQIEKNPQENTKLIKILKTYKGKTKLAESLIQNPKNDTNLSSKMGEASTHQIDDTVLDTSYKITEYCLCSDFGQLTYYDKDSFYEHIHFGQRNTVLCDVDTIFSIYVDKQSTKEYDVYTSLETLKESPEESWHKICWNEIYDAEEKVRISLDKLNLHIVSEQFRSNNSKMNKSNDHFDKEQNIIHVKMTERDDNNITEKSDEGTKSEDLTIPNSSLISKSELMKDDKNKVQAVYVVKGRNVSKTEESNKARHVNKGGDTSKVRDDIKAADANKVKDLNVIEALSIPVSNAEDLIKAGYSMTAVDANEVVTLYKGKVANKARVSSKVVKAKARYTNKAGDTNKVGDSEEVSGANSSKVGDAFKDKDTNKAGDANKGEDVSTGTDASEAGDASKVGDARKAGEESKAGDPNEVTKANTKTGKKRKRSICDTKEEEESSVDNNEPLSKRDVKCGVCGQILAKRDWEEHSIKEHGSIAWKTGDKCISNTPTASAIMEPKKTKLSRIVKCGACELDIESSEWVVHIRQGHNYIAWQSGETPLEINDEGPIIKHLRNIIRGHGPLVCFKCESERQYGIKSIKTFLEHIKLCNENNAAETEIGSRNLKKMGFDDANTCTCLGKKQVAKCGNLIKINKFGTLNEDLIEQKTVNCDSAEECHIESDTLISPVEEKTKRRSHSNKAGKDKGVKCGDSPMKMNIDPERTSTPRVKNKSEKSGDSSKKINFDTATTTEKPVKLESEAKIDTNTEVTSTPLVKEKSVKRGSHKKKYSNVESIPLAKDKSLKLDDSPLDSNTDAIYTSTPLNKETVVKRVYSSKKTGSNSTPTAEEVTVKCGVCKKEMGSNLWNDHLHKVHDYLTWKEGESSLDLQDKDQIWQHLHSISKKCDGLVCSKCGLTRKYVKAYLSHIKQCDGMMNSTEENSSKNIESSLCEEKDAKHGDHSISIDNALYGDSATKGDNDSGTTLVPLAEQVVVKCGLCKQEMEDSLWNEHMQTAHNYMAWKQGESSLDLQDKDQIWQHLHSISKKCDGLVCSKCGLIRKYVKAYLSHVKQCDGTSDSAESKDAINIFTPPGKDEIAKYSDQSQEVKTERTETPSVIEMLVKYNDSAMEVDNDSKTALIPLAEQVVVKCGVCNREMDGSHWDDHVQKAHNYLAWKEGESSLDLKDKDQIWQHLHSISKKCNGLVCSKCGLNRKYPKAYISHVLQCDGMNPNNKSLSLSFMDTSCISEVNTSQSENFETLVEIKCGVCSELCLNRDWIMHIQSRHDYLAWREGEPPLNFQDQEAIENHLRSIVKKQGTLRCRNCGEDRKYGAKTVYKYLRHIKSCGKYIDIEIDDTKLLSNSPIPSDSVVTKCGVCEQDIEDANWIEHIGLKHSYLAWKHGEEPLELENTEKLKLHLFQLLKQVDVLKCSKCGVEKKYPKNFLDHINTCDATAIVDTSKLKNTDGFTECGVCSEKMDCKKWKSHALEKHYNVAWRLGDYPIDVKSPYVVEKYLKEYRQIVGKLVCRVCGISRASLIGFYAHVVLCGKSEEEAGEFQNVCEICNKTYVVVYKNQHMAAHVQQVYAKERKIQSLQKEKEVAETADTTVDESQPQGRRRAAVKARDHIKKLKTNEEDDPKICDTCGFEGSTARKLARHKCATVSFESGTETEYSYESGESDASAESKIETDVSEEDEIEHSSSKKRYKESVVTAKVPNVPFQYQKLNRHTMRSEDFLEKHFTDEILFPEWLNCKHEHLEDSQLTDYLPKIEKSCKIKLDEQWDTFKRFQVKKYNKGCSMFLGGTVQCLSWVPSRLNDDDQSGNYLAVSCHQYGDVPRYNYDELSAHSAMIQIWDFSTLRGTLPKLALCIAHDYGTVWAMDWCPSGARSVIASDDKFSRMGLLAVACSNGFVYILSVPYPSSIAKSDKVFCKLKPVAELRISMTSERKPYQATAISWSKQKGHAVVMVGYADGTTALYDLCSSSPLLKCVENGVAVFYPYQDQRDHNGSVSDVDIWPGGATVGAVCSASVAGSAMRHAGARVDGRSPANACAFTPGWPSVLFAADDIIAIQSVNELDWYGCGRRLGPVRTFCSCQYCSRVLVYIRPLLRYMDALPPYTDFKKQSIALIRTTPFAKKRKIQNDDLAMLVEPLTYDDVITQYGVQVVVDSNEKNPTINSLREQFTERFPLADVTAMAFCTAARHHRVAAVGLQAGFVLILTV